MSEETATPPVAPPVQELTPDQEIQVLRSAHEFFGNFNGVPGFAATKWGQALDAIALVANSLISKAGLLAPLEPPAEAPPAEAPPEVV